MKLLRVILLFINSCLPALADLPANWSTNYTATISEAKAAQTPALAFFTASWCGPCKLMTRMTLSDLAVVQTLSEFKHVAVDIDENQALASQHNVEAVPTFILFSAAGDEVARTSGFQAPEEFMQWLTNGVSAAKEVVARQALMQKKLADVDQLLTSTNSDSDTRAASELFELCSARDETTVHDAVSRLQQLAARAPKVLLDGLNDTHLSTRIQVANALRARLGETFDVDPWADAACRGKGVEEWRRRL